ncbi:MAG: ComEC/Rec2 family competence protein [bacterium]|nr:ComEC/Rec2 family competence protein [bacterium]
MSRILFFACLAYIAGVFTWSATPLGKQLPNEYKEYVGKYVALEGVIADDPNERRENIQIALRPKGGKGKVLATTDAFGGYRFGDKVLVRGTLLSPPRFEEFDYPGFLSAKNIHAVMYYPEVTVLEKGNNPLFLLKDRLRSILKENLSFSKSATFGALVLGDQGRMSEDWKNKLNVTGLRHITAISGQHVVILTRMLLPLFLWLGLWRRQAVLMSFACMVAFILLTGMQASAIRAGIMGGLLLFAEYIGRMNVALRGIVFAAALMLFFNPRLLLNDPGFQLSFLASLGIIFALPLFSHLLKKVPEALALRENLAVNFSAQLFVLPLLIHNFGYVSVIGVVTNLLLLPIIPFLIGLGFLFLLGGLASQALAVLLSLPITLLLGYYHFIVNFFFEAPLASLALPNVSFFWFLPFYLAVYGMIKKYANEKSLGFSG